MDFDKYLGIPWRRGGRSREGCDCWGLVWLFFRDEIGIDIPDYLDAYDHDCHSGELGDLIRRETGSGVAWRKVGMAEPGAVAILNRSGQPCHAGIVAPGNRLLHVESDEIAACIVPITDCIGRRLIGFFKAEGQA